MYILKKADFKLSLVPKQTYHLSRIFRPLLALWAPRGDVGSTSPS